MSFLSSILPDGANGSGDVGLGAARRQLVRRWHRHAAERRRIAQHTRELESYTDRELAELGLDRSDIPAVARGTYERS